LIKVENSVRAVDEAVIGRLRHAITSDGDEEEQLNGVLRMLGAETPSKNQLPLFGKAAAGEAPKATQTIDGA
jgi:SOS-response transcriptional repressor LexA